MIIHVRLIEHTRLANDTMFKFIYAKLHKQTFQANSSIQEGIS